MWENRRLRDIAEGDLRQLVESELEEHLQLEYKSALYETNERGNKEFLQDICMFANAQGGTLLIGVQERRDEQGQPTGSPDPAAPLGVQVQNPEAVLQAYDARVVASIEDRLPLESAAIPVADGLHVLAIRVPNSLRKPHCVRYQGQVYFPSRRERNRYPMDVREIKEMVMRSASQIEQSEQRLSAALLEMARQDDAPHLVIASIPVFGQDFMIDVRAHALFEAMRRFSFTNPPNLNQPYFNFTGLERQLSNDVSAVQTRRNGLIVMNNRMPLREVEREIARFFPERIDYLLRIFVQRIVDVYRTAAVQGPYLLSMMLRVKARVIGSYAGTIPGSVEDASQIDVGDYRFPTMQADNFVETDRVIRPLCDQAHQTFGRRSSPRFNIDGVWIEPAR